MSKTKSEFYAYGEDHAGLETIMRLHAVKRWHMIDTTRQQTLAEHTANVALLAYYIAATAPEMYFGPSHVSACIALMHDLEETFTGDIMTHTKRRLTGIKELEQELLPKVFSLQVAPCHGTPAAFMVKMCDLADGIRFIRLHGVDVTSRHAREGLEEQLHAKYNEACGTWPKIVAHKVMNDLVFYAYETS
jgi:hypothetical protein